MLSADANIGKHKRYDVRSVTTKNQDGTDKFSVLYDRAVLREISDAKYACSVSRIFYSGELHCSSATSLLLTDLAVSQGCSAAITPFSEQLPYISLHQEIFPVCFSLDNLGTGIFPRGTVDFLEHVKGDDSSIYFHPSLSSAVESSLSSKNALDAAFCFFLFNRWSQYLLSEACVFFRNVAEELLFPTVEQAMINRISLFVEPDVLDTRGLNWSDVRNLTNFFHCKRSFMRAYSEAGFEPGNLMYLPEAISIAWGAFASTKIVSTKQESTFDMTYVSEVAERIHIRETVHTIVEALRSGVESTDIRSVLEAQADEKIIIPVFVPF